MDEKAGEITALMLTDNKTEDASVLKNLVSDTFDQGVDTNKVGVDGAYDTYECMGHLGGSRN